MVPPALPPALAARLDELVGRFGRAQLEAARARLSEAYRAHAGARAARTPAEAAAYAAYRAPATFAAVGAVLASVRARRPEWRPRSLLDVGAGTGAASWAALAVWPELERVVLVEVEPRMAALGRELAAAAGGQLAGAEWVVADADAAAGSHDLVLASYLLNELDEPRARDLASRLWSHTADTMAVVEPGTPLGYGRVLAARAAVVAAGGSTLAPCPHDRPCPLEPPDWCHFAVRLERGEAHRAVKAVSRGFEDEKLSYAVLTRSPVEPAQARIIRQPQPRSGHVRLELCAREGVRGTVVSKRDRDAYRRARKARWGDAWEI
jgi:ribosomal protein RSM22 (predicted rRNA methylase)